MRKIKINNANLEKRAYWLYLHPYVYMSVKDSRALIYNTLNGRLHEYNGNTEILKILKRLNTEKNLYVIRLKQKELTAPIQKFISDIRETYSGDFMDSSYSDGKPVQLKPTLAMNINFDETTYRNKIKIFKNDHIRDYLRVINLYINNECNGNCEVCGSAYKQFLYCNTNGTHRKELDISEIRLLLDGVDGSVQLNITGGDIQKHSQLPELIALLNNYKGKKDYFLNYLNFDKKNDSLRLLEQSESNTLHILIHFPLERQVLSGLMTFIECFNIKKIFHFVIQNGADMTAIEGLIHEHNLIDVELHPYYSGNNLKFFEDNIFTTKESLMDNKPTMRNIFANGIINILGFRQLTVMYDKYIYANLNHSRIGKLGKNNLSDILKKELKQGKSWGKIRKDVSPCKRCVYNAICPPISNYEYAIGQYDLCKINK